jgi:hypothetical protein
MNPYLEQPAEWENVHNSLIIAIQNDLAPRVRPIQLSDRLPTISIPLADGEAELPLDLQSILHDVYDSGNYDLVAYRSEPTPPLSAELQSWAHSILTAHGIAIPNPALREERFQRFAASRPFRD